MMEEKAGVEAEFQKQRGGSFDGFGLDCQSV